MRRRGRGGAGAGGGGEGVERAMQGGDRGKNDG